MPGAVKPPHGTLRRHGVSIPGSYALAVTRICIKIKHFIKKQLLGE